MASFTNDSHVLPDLHSSARANQYVLWYQAMNNETLYRAIRWGLNAAAFTVGFCIAVNSVRANESPATHPIAGQPDIDTEAHAAVLALETAKGYSGTVEYAGAIYRQGGVYHYTQAIRGDTYSFNMRIFIPRDATLTAIYHTHPGDAISNLFSPLDVQNADHLNVHSYVGDMGTNTVIEYIPKQSKVFDSGRLHAVSSGSVIGGL